MTIFYICLCAFFLNLCYGTSKIYDCFTFFNELEILMIRLEELYDVVDHFVIVEGSLTFTGKPKSHYFAENRHLFSRFEDKIIYILVEDFPSPTNDLRLDAWRREHHQRNQIIRGLSHCAPRDIIIISDVDEIPRHDVIANLPRIGKNIFNLDMQYFRYQLNRIDPRISSETSHGGRIAPYYLVNRYGDLNKFVHFPPKRSSISPMQVGILLLSAILVS